ncbi:hypothetical protein H6758_00565 [Candidatus Nomurabacteria bacterium]|nr:hypothetical protein [Candidatus Nomurabacteria bacterium]
MLSFFRVIKFAIQDFFRNFSLSFMTILTLVLMLLSVNALIAFRVVGQHAIEMVEDQINISIYFSHTASDEHISEIVGFVQSFPEVEQTTFKTPDQVLEEFRTQHAANHEILASLDELGENPLGATLIVKTNNPEDYENIITAIDIPEYQDIIDAQTFGDTQAAIENIRNITERVERVSLSLAIMFGLIAFIIIFNTIRVAIYTQREEISIKKLVGATDWFVKGPYIVQSIFFTVISIAVTSYLVMFIWSRFDPYWGLIWHQADFLTNYYNSNILFLLSSQTAAVLVLTIFSATLAMRRYLRT